MSDLNMLVQLGFLKLKGVNFIMQPGLATMFHNLFQNHNKMLSKT